MKITASPAPLMAPLRHMPDLPPVDASAPVMAFFDEQKRPLAYGIAVSRNSSTHAHNILQLAQQTQPLQQNAVALASLMKDTGDAWNFMRGQREGAPASIVEDVEVVGLAMRDLWESIEKHESKGIAIAAVNTVATIADIAYEHGAFGERFELKAAFYICRVAAGWWLTLKPVAAPERVVAPGTQLYPPCVWPSINRVLAERSRTDAPCDHPIAKKR